MISDSPAGFVGPQGDPGPNSVLAGGTEPVAVDADSATISGFSAGGTGYFILAVPNWPTAFWEIAVSASDFTLGFLVPAPSGATLRWAVIIP